MKEYILLTGASSGIGYEMANQLAAKKLNLILVARTEAKLQQMQAELTAKFDILVQYFVADLSEVNAAMELYVKVQQENLMVTHLVNNAGVGNYGHFIETSLEEELGMIELNISSLVEGTGVTVISLYPGTVDTGFTTSEMQTTNLHKTKPMHPKEVAMQGVKHLLEGKGKKVVGFQNWLNSKLPNFVPDSIMMKIKKGLASQK